MAKEQGVLIPLLLDDLLWALNLFIMNFHEMVLIPLLLDDLLWVVIVIALYATLT